MKLIIENTGQIMNIDEEKSKNELNALMDLEIARKEAIHYIEMGTDTFAIRKGEIEIRRKKEVENE